MPAPCSAPLTRSRPGSATPRSSSPGRAARKVSLVGVFSAAAVERGLSAADVIRLAAAIVGGGGGGKPEVAQAGGRDVERIGEALQTARTAVENGLR